MIKHFFILISVSAFLCGCTSSISPQTYSVGSVGQVNRTVSATVISSREVDIAGTTGMGSTAGTATGAVIGSAAGGNNARGNIVGAIGGAVVGAIIGASIEANSTKQKGIEYVVETETGNLMTIVQGVEPLFINGQRVFVLYGSPSRLIADPRIKF
ncbi:MAG: glycine zipper domain-containing protein [Burkholderiaceae bacterium]